MEPRKLSRILFAWIILGAGCSLLQDPDSLTDGTKQAMAAAGASGAAGGRASGGASSGECAPSEKDTSCDGLDQNCAATLTDTACPSGCKGLRYSGKSYMACAVSATFADAEVLCEQQGMKLVEIDDASENSFVTQTAQTLGSYVWLGGSDLESLGTFRWQSGLVFFQNGAAVNDVYSSFDAGEPSALTGLDCVQLHDDGAGPWSSAKCGDSKQFVCER